MVVLDNATGDVLAYVGASGDLSRRRARSTACAARRQAGSTLKPFLYALALERRLLTAASLLDDTPAARSPRRRGLYVPQNYDRAFKGVVSACAPRSAQSLNVPAVRTLDARSASTRFHERLRTLGLRDASTEPAEHYGASLALGGADVTLLALTNAYRALANGGVVGGRRGSRRSDEPAPGAARARSRRGVHRRRHPRRPRRARAHVRPRERRSPRASWAAVKTGTSKDMRDNWCVGFTDALHGRRVGRQLLRRADARRLRRDGAAPVWQEIVNRLHRGAPSRPPAPPPGVVVRRVRFDGDLEAARDEWFVAGTEMAEVRIAGTATRPRIAYPGEGTIVALDPDIPAAQQRIALRAAGPGSGGSWRIDDRPAGDAHGVTLWLPAPGRHRLALLDAGGREVDAVRFEVRGAPYAVRVR